MFLSSLMDLLAFCASTLGLRLRFYSCVAFAVLFPALAARRFSSPRTVVVFVPGFANELSTLTRTSRKKIAAPPRKTVLLRRFRADAVRRDPSFRRRGVCAETPCRDSKAAADRKRSAPVAWFPDRARRTFRTSSSFFLLLRR